MISSSLLSRQSSPQRQTRRNPTTQRESGEGLVICKILQFLPYAALRGKGNKFSKEEWLKNIWEL